MILLETECPRDDRFRWQKEKMEGFLVELSGARPRAQGFTHTSQHFTTGLHTQIVEDKGI